MRLLPVLAAAVVLGSLGVAHADTINTFSLSAVLVDGTASGTLVLDFETTGKFTASSFIRCASQRGLRNLCGCASLFYLRVKLCLIQHLLYAHGGLHVQPGATPIASLTRLHGRFTLHHDGHVSRQGERAGTGGSRPRRGHVRFADACASDRGHAREPQACCYWGRAFW